MHTPSGQRCVLPVNSDVYVCVAAPLGGSVQLVFTCRLPRRVLEETVFSRESLKCMSTRLTAAGLALGACGRGCWRGEMLAGKGKTVMSSPLTYPPTVRHCPPPLTHPLTVPRRPPQLWPTLRASPFTPRPELFMNVCVPLRAALSEGSLSQHAAGLGTPTRNVPFRQHDLNVGIPTLSVAVPGR